MLRFGLVALLGVFVVPAGALEVTVHSGLWKESPVESVNPSAESFSMEFRVDPVATEGGDLQVIAGAMVGLKENESVQSGEGGQLRVDFREGGDRAAFTLWHRKTNLTLQQPDPRPPGWMDNRDYQHPHVLPFREGKGHWAKLIVWPEGEGSRVRLFVDFEDRPVEEHLLPERVQAGKITLFTMRGGNEPDLSRTTRFSEVQFSELTPEAARRLPSMAESVLGAIDLSTLAMRPIAQALEKGQQQQALALFLHHMRNRQQPKGPAIEEVADVVLHPDWQTIADNALVGKYGSIGYFTSFVEAWTDTKGESHPWVLQNDPLQVNWARCNGHLNRHFHWVSLARAWQENHDPKYARRFSAEVHDWVSREPFFWAQCPTVGGANLMDGTTFRWGYMNTSNIGRRLELTWWPAYETFRHSPDFTDEAHVAILLGMLRQARLIMNPSSFAAHDDGGAHTTLALLQTALMLPEFSESLEWKATAMKRWDIILEKQFHPDGSHVSLSTGYNWASLVALENYLRLYKRFGAELPESALSTLEKAAEHPMLLTAPSQAQVDLNDGGWSTIEDRYQSLFEWFPDRTDFQWMASRGAKGSPPEETSVYFPNAGHYVMRTGWGAEEKYLFFGAGPWGASHGKFDALNIYAQLGNHLLIRNAGRGSYSGVGNTKHAGRSLSFNTLSPDWAQENSIPQWKHDMAVGFNPPERRWLDNDRFSYGEGAFTYGWYNPDEHIQGKWLRQVIFVKGNDPRRDGYYLVIDTVEPADDKERTWRHPWQLGLNASDIAINETDKSATAIASVAALQILPVDPVGDIQVKMIQGQESPELLGWRIYDTTASPWPVPTYEWKSSGTFSRAWVIQMQADPSQWPVTKVETSPSKTPGELRFQVHLKSGQTDHVLRRFPEEPPAVLFGKTFPGDIAILSADAKGNTVAKLVMENGTTSVARRRE
ncbi:MAG: hypothetical protein CMO55_12035 [Verrucomicrobiales bacterium]|nr:hypothetical protein [Verrucomicrobiales bacterium]